MDQAQQNNIEQHIAQIDNDINEYDTISEQYKHFTTGNKADMFDEQILNR